MKLISRSGICIGDSFIRFISLLTPLILISACTEGTLLEIPDFRRGGFLAQTDELPVSKSAKLEGVWEVIKGTEVFGDSIAIMVSGDRLTVYAQPSAGYIVLETGVLDSVVFLQGYWRQQVNSNTGLVNLYLPKLKGGGWVSIDGSARPDTLLMVGTYGNGEANPSKDIVLRWIRPFSVRAMQPYLVIAHRGGGRTSDRIPYSENTVELIRIAERFGSNAIEVDVRLSRDGIPFIYHDSKLNPRLVQRGALVGPAESYPMKALKDFVTLVQGESIPTLEEALKTVVFETNLRGVYLDTKTENVGLVSKMIPLVQKAIQDVALVENRPPLTIVIGIPTQVVYDEFVRIPNHKLVPSLCELSLDQAIAINSLVWAPRWTLGTQDAEIQRAHNQMMAAVTWTMDIDEFIKEYVNNSSFDGILTNYPSLVRYYQLMR
ncbi:MAG: glycerophosphodiester phosphodiesterase [Ignavibacteria bacterium]|nr:glycerophosphodiester phosphodiesterase [Ignavibacteria bacterium]